MMLNVDILFNGTTRNRVLTHQANYFRLDIEHLMQDISNKDTRRT